jgi:hypothetical protein
MEITKETIVDVDLRGAAAILRPIVFKDGNTYCVLLGADQHDGVFGSGPTVEDAIEDWTKSLDALMQDNLALKRIISAQDPQGKVAEFLKKFRIRARQDRTGYDTNKSF